VANQKAQDTKKSKPNYYGKSEKKAKEVKK
jgi:hypothetical protein